MFPSWSWFSPIVLGPHLPSVGKRSCCTVQACSFFQFDVRKNPSSLQENCLHCFKGWLLRRFFSYTLCAFSSQLFGLLTGGGRNEKNTPNPTTAQQKTAEAAAVFRRQLNAVTETHHLLEFKVINIEWKLKANCLWKSLPTKLIQNMSKCLESIFSC